MSLSSSSSSSPSQTTTIANVVAATGDKNVEDNNLQIFLGGSCNPTTWRRNVAIPYLELNGISYYNPQVDNWTPESVDSERQAKQNAQILLFVIDKQTRSTVSLVESAFMAGENKNLVSVIYPFEYNAISITDTCKQTSNIIETRSKLTRTSRTTYNNSKNESSSSSFTQSSSSTKTSSTLITASTASESSLTSTIATRASSTRTNFTGTKISSQSESPDEIDETNLNAVHEEAQQTSGIIKINDEVISLNEFRELKQARCMLESLLVIRNIPKFSDIHQALKYVSCSLRDSEGSYKLQPQVLNSFNSSSKTLNKNYLLSHFHTQTDQQYVHHQNREESPTSIVSSLHDCKSSPGDAEFNLDSSTKDIYLSLESDDRLGMETTIISILKEKGLTYHTMSVSSIVKPKTHTSTAESLLKLSLDTHKSTPTATSIVTGEVTGHSTGGFEFEEESTKLAIEKEICAIRSSRVILFVITNKCRGLSVMVLASHFMALFRNNVVLCVQYLEEPCSIGGETLTKAAIADYNRGRVYLCDYAVKSQVPVFSTIREAIDCCSQRCLDDNKN